MNKQELFLKFDKDVSKRSRWFRFLLSVDQLFNVVLWNGSQDETISSHISRKQSSGTATRFDNLVCCLLKKIEQNDCDNSRGE